MCILQSNVSEPLRFKLETNCETSAAFALLVFDKGDKEASLRSSYADISSNYTSIECVSIRKEEVRDIEHDDEYNASTSSLGSTPGHVQASDLTPFMVKVQINMTHQQDQAMTISHFHPVQQTFVVFVVSMLSSCCVSIKISMTFYNAYTHTSDCFAPV